MLHGSPASEGHRPRTSLQRAYGLEEKEGNAAGTSARILGQGSPGNLQKPAWCRWQVNTERWSIQRASHQGQKQPQGSGEAAGMFSLDKALPLLTAGGRGRDRDPIKQSSLESPEGFRGTDDHSPMKPLTGTQFINSRSFPPNQPASTGLRHSVWLIPLTFPSFSGAVGTPESFSLLPPPAPAPPVGIEWEPECCLRKEKLQNHKLQKIVTAKTRKEHTISAGLLKSNCAFYGPLGNSGSLGNFLTHTTQKTVLRHQRPWPQRLCVVEKKQTKKCGFESFQGPSVAQCRSPMMQCYG